MDRSRLVPALRSGARLAAVLLPVAAFGVLRLTSADGLTLQSWVAPGVSALAAAFTAAALVPTAAAALLRGRLRDLADAAGLAVLTALLGLVAVDATTSDAADAGLGLAAIVFLAGSLVGSQSLTDPRARWGGGAVIFAVAELALGGILLVGSGGIDPQFATLLAPAAAAILLAAAAIGIRDPARATALGLLASASIVQALTTSGQLGSLVATAGISLGAALFGWQIVSREVITDHETTPAAEPPLLPELHDPAISQEPERGTEARMARELRGTIEELIEARRLVELQRVELERTARTDRLTGLATRDTILERLQIETAEARRYAHPVALVLLDIDDFGTLNHEHGLEVGDAVLREVALRLRMRTREADALGRVGADSFLAILPHTDERGATALAEALRVRATDRPLATLRGELSVAVSIGIALMRPGMSFSDEELLTAAEEALASAQAAGGNRIAFDRLHGLARLDERQADIADETS